MKYWILYVYPCRGSFQVLIDLKESIEKPGEKWYEIDYNEFQRIKKELQTF